MIHAGPILFARGADERCFRLASLVIRHVGAVADDRFPEDVQGLRPIGGNGVAPVELARFDGQRLLRYEFELPARAGAFHEHDGARHDVVTESADSLRIAFVSCNGMEHGDAARVAEERNLMWRRLLAVSARRLGRGHDHRAERTAHP